jgi:hypothetical protein
MTRINERVAALDLGLFEPIESQTSGWDQLALLALHGVVADRYGSFCYLEVGSYLGGSIQVLIRDPRCELIISIDRRVALAPDIRGGVSYDRNTTAHMRERLAQVPAADLGKLTSLESSTESLEVGNLPRRPRYCLIDAEHTDQAALRDARFCAQALGGEGIIAFHDFKLVGGAIRAFVRESWGEVSGAVAFADAVFAIELGGGGMLSTPLVKRAIGSRWHSLVWTTASRLERSPGPFLAAWSVVPVLDSAVARTRARFGRPSATTPHTARGSDWPYAQR